MHDNKKLRNFDVSTGVNICFMYCLCYWKFGGCRNIYRMLWLGSFCLSFPSIVLWYMYCIATVSCSGSCRLRIQHLTHHDDMRVSLWMLMVPSLCGCVCSGWSTAGEGEQDHIHQDTTTIWVLLTGILQTRHNYKQCWESGGGSQGWPHWKFSLYG